jgi:hypothetical protein
MVKGILIFFAYLAFLYFLNFVLLQRPEDDE